MKKTIVIYFLLSLTLFTNDALAQWSYVVDVLRGDSTALVQRVKSKDKDNFMCGDTVGW